MGMNFGNSFPPPLRWFQTWHGRCRCRQKLLWIDRCCCRELEARTPRMHKIADVRFCFAISICFCREFKAWIPSIHKVPRSLLRYGFANQPCLVWLTRWRLGSYRDPKPRAPKLSKKNKLGCRKWGCNKWGLKGCLATLPGNRPFSPFLCLFRPFPEGAKSTWEILKTEEKGLFPQISSDLLKPPSLKPPFAALQIKNFPPDPNSLKNSRNLHAQYDWTTGAPDNGNEWRKFRAVPRSYPLRSLVLYFV